MQTGTASVRTLYQKIELGDILGFFYLLVLTRQYLWTVSNNILAWILTFAFTFSLAYVSFRNRKGSSRSKIEPYSFFLIVALPLFVIYAFRFVFPDYSFDVLNYHILSGERSLSGWPSAPSFFLPPFDPLPDMLTGIYRHLFGYRLGTIVNYLTLIWTATILVKILRTHIERIWVVHLAALLIVLTEGLLLEINNYLVDLLALPLLLQATYLLLYVREPRMTESRQFYIAFLLGFSVALKVTNLFIVIPFTVVWAQRLITSRFKLRPIVLLIILFAFITPLIPYGIQLFRERESARPLYANVAAASSAITSFSDPRWGPVGLGETLIWPALLYSKAKRASEFAIYSGKIPLGFILALCFLPLKQIDRNIRALGFVVAVGAFLWSLSSGYTRYASCLELLSGLLIVYLCCFIGKHLQMRARLGRALLFLPLTSLAALSFFSLNYTLHYDWSLRPTFFDSRSVYINECQRLLGDYSLHRFLPAEKEALLNMIGIWIVSAEATSGFESLLRPDVPAVSLPVYPVENIDKLFEDIPDARKKRMFSLCFLQEVGKTVELIALRKMGVGQITTLALPYYSYYHVYKLVLVEVLPVKVKGLAKALPTFSTAGGPLPATAFQVDISSHGYPRVLKAESKAVVYVTVKNVSAVSWPGQGSGDKPYAVNLGNHWIDSYGNIVALDDGRTPLPFELAPGEEVELPLLVTVPRLPGYYALEMDMVQETVAWFSGSGMGSRTLKANVKVE